MIGSRKIGVSFKNGIGSRPKAEGDELMDVLTVKLKYSIKKDCKKKISSKKNLNFSANVHF